MKRKQFLTTLSLLPLTGTAMKLNELSKITSSFDSTELMPLLFLGHGSPMNAIEQNEFTEGFRDISTKFEKPKAILCISAHWETRGTFLTAMEHPQTIHDFGGFPQALYDVQYPAPGSPELASEVQQLITSTDAGLTDKWGLDHGAWSVIRHLYPDADIPVIEMSIDYTQGPQYHYNLGRELAALRRKGVLIIGSGNLVHNLRMVDWKRMNDIGYGFDWAEEARAKMNEWILSGNHQPLIQYEQQGTAFKLAIPSPDHYLPLLYVLGLKGEKEEISLFNDKTMAGSLSMTSVFIHKS
ncbi:4,5-DOPA-extradiol-dioxygenase [Mangrovibacterium diazotrophicum]|uniref:4,5-DOPA dioxygenase extradiol n=1 Tax=Mangrovibacterium diazotrophicum TaxID=1261403 RepID=A0A419W873_9BACT|nr:4,5-DOPA dioxygenase extradiol [Mangrovibacterium diazotrophicum]RKD91630.1 4,5-DOPA dioxygenase extradiol [Mangrovibacterium diazotrophicum]